jgi:hypothetical protein
LLVIGLRFSWSIQILTSDLFFQKNAGKFGYLCRRVAQRESASLTRKKSAVRNRPRLPDLSLGNSIKSLGFAVVGLPQRLVPGEAFLHLEQALL